MNYINFLYVLLFFISIYFIIQTPLNQYKRWLPKSILFSIGVIIYIFSIFVNNNYINKYILPLFLFLNIAILIFTTFSYKINLLNIFGLIGLIFFIMFFNYKEFEFKNGLLIKPNKFLIYFYILILSIYFLLTTYVAIFDKIYLIIILYYPLLFPLNEYFKHRIFSLLFITSTMNYLKYNNVVKFLI